MIFHLLRNAIYRNFAENRLLINQITDDMLRSEPIASGRSLGKILLHMIRSYEYYTRGLALNVWEPLQYDLAKFPTIEKIWELYEAVVTKIQYCLDNLYLSPAVLNDVLEDFNRPATKAEILLEMLEHSVQHRGQILVYLRLHGVEPAKIPFII
ncbi:MAG: DinB family protein [Candidatus Hodarchaeota archaeon]